MVLPQPGPVDLSGAGGTPPGNVISQQTQQGRNYQQQTQSDVQNFLNSLYASLHPGTPQAPGSPTAGETMTRAQPGAKQVPSDPQAAARALQIRGQFDPNAFSPQAWAQAATMAPSYPKPVTSGKKKSDPAADPNSLAGRQSMAQWLIGQIPNMSQGQLNSPTSHQQQALIDAINNLDPADAQKVMAALPQNATITKDVMKAEQPGGPSTPNDVLTMGMNLFMNQYMQPIMQKMNAANMQAVGQYGNAMNQALQGPLPPGVAQFAKAMAPQMEGNMAMLNQANMAQAAGAPMFNAFMSGVGGQAQNLQALIDIYTKLSSAADVQQLYGTSGLPGVLGAAATGGTTGTSGTAGTTPPATAGGTPAINLTPAQVIQSFLQSQGG